MFEKFSEGARAAVVYSQEEARDSSADRITATHLLLGVMDTASGDGLHEVFDAVGLDSDTVRAGTRVITDQDAAALRGIGIDVSAVADAVSQRFGVDIFGPIRKRFRKGHIPFDSGAKKALELALRESVNRKDGFIGTEHVVLGVLRSDDAEALSAIESVTTRDELRRRVYGLLDERAA